MALALAVSCAKNNPNNPTEDPNTPPDNEWVNNPNFTKLQQKWKYDNYNGGYDITADKVDDWAETAVNYSVSIKYIKWISDTAGIIYGQYTSEPYWAPGVKGKYYAFAFLNLTETTIEISGASGDGNYTDTLTEAISKFTVDNSGKGPYFGVYSKCIVTK
ncbi:hypothetical protein Bint_1590 [Brachyspira intermedia PWS/A]|uniref:Uncharacterized protein n=2 Tax=Brachyspira intermedia TaxID=84377 RepID=G0EI50_BRAIP|nr:hypothetical protein Bint_1590 [Brachyspira intermedia PWS/A]